MNLVINLKNFTIMLFQPTAKSGKIEIMINKAIVYYTINAQAKRTPTVHKSQIQRDEEGNYYFVHYGSMFAAIEENKFQLNEFSQI